MQIICLLLGWCDHFSRFPFSPCSFFRIFAAGIKQKTCKDMGLGSYWVRKDDQTGEAKTLKPWEEAISNGDKFFPDPNQEGEDVPDSPVPSKE
jgi:hypothetical protein